MNSLSEFLSSPLLDFIHSNLPNNNTKQPDELYMLLETLSESDIQLLDKRVTDDLGDDKHQQDQGITVANASNNLCHSMCLEILVTTPLRRVLLLQLHKLI